MSVFQHENQSCPLSLSQDGKLRLPQKTSVLAECIQSFTTPQLKMPEEINAIIIDGSVVVNMIKPATERTSAEDSRKSFLPFIRSQLSHAKRLNFVWDEYIANSSKDTTRSNRGRKPGGAYSRPVKYYAIGSTSYGVKKTSKTKTFFQVLAQCILSLHERKGHHN